MRERRAVQVLDGEALLPLHGRAKFYGWARIDIEDLDRTKHIAWTIDGRGYVVGRPPALGAPITLHRWLMQPGRKVVDHVSGDKLDNRRGNLRLCTQGENSKNRRTPKCNRSGVKGVSQKPNGRWRARIMVWRKEIVLGCFATREEAALVYDNAAMKYHGEFARPNKVRVVKLAMAGA